MSVQSLSTLILRILGFITFLFGLTSLITGVLASYGKIGLVYWQTFLLTIVLPPALWVVLGLFLLLFARAWGRWLSKGL